LQPELIGGRYRVERAIGQGGMGTVWLCRDEKLARDVAVKQVGLLPGESVTDSARALREARSSAALSHRNVVTVFDVVDQDGHIWMVMENVPSRSLSDLIRDEGALPPERVAAIGAQVADGLASAHAAGITHRDVKPGNVLIRDDGVAKISDFGIARTAGDPALTQTGLFIGTPTYFSPELARGAEPDPSADVWALGATLYAAVEGRPPYEQKTNAVAVISEIANQPPPPPQRAGALEPVLRRMLDSDPVSRWSMADAAHALHRLADRHSERTRSATTAAFAGAGAGAATGAATSHWADEDSAPASVGTTRPAAAAPPPPRPAPPADRDESPRRRGRLLVLLAAVALLLVGGVAFAAITQDGDPSTSPEASDSPTADHQASDKPSPSATRTPEQSPSPEQTTSPAAPPATGGDRVGFLQDYFGTVPGDLDTGWSMLSPRMQAEVGRDSYDGFWGTVSSVEASDFSPHGDTVDLTLRYTMDDGSVQVERHRIDLVRGDNGYLVDDDTAIG
jgi:serine/threonine protein kinase